jgi:hypothetical protein
MSEAIQLEQPPPGETWIEIVRRPTLDEFSRAFASDAAGFRELSSGGFVDVLGHLLLLECGSEPLDRHANSDREACLAARLAPRQVRHRYGLASAEMPRNRLSKGNDLIEGAMM